MGKSKIEWCDYTWNPLRGCTNRCWADDAHPEGNCYAACMARRNLPLGCDRCHNHLDVHTHMERLDEPLRWRGVLSPYVVFAGSMADLYCDDAPSSLRLDMYAVMLQRPAYQFVILTKCPFRATPFEFLNPHTDMWAADNLMLGVSVGSAAEMWRINVLHDNRASWRARYPDRRCGLRLGASLEPLQDNLTRLSATTAALSRLDWAAVGLATGQLARQHPEWAGSEALQWAREAVFLLNSLHVPCFIKDSALPAFADMPAAWILQHRRRPNYHPPQLLKPWDEPA